MIAGEDAKAIEQLARYQTPQDFWKAHTELRGKLSERAQPARLAENATPEQVAEYRKGLGLPEVAKDAPPEKYMEAYKVAFPEGYAATDFEKGMVTDFTKQAYAKGWSPAEVKGATDFFFQQQEAANQARNTAAVNRQKEWQNAMRDEMGSRDYDAQTAAATDWLKAQFAEDESGFIELTRAELPGGGYLGDHPWFVKTMAKLAMGDGYTDRIEANAYESSGKSLEQQQSELEALRNSDPRLYNDPKTQTRLDKIIELRLKKGEIDEMGRPVQRRRSA